MKIRNQITIGISVVAGVIMVAYFLAMPTEYVHQPRVAYIAGATPPAEPSQYPQW